jgi:excisionase family DNA binding protein
MSAQQQGNGTILLSVREFARRLGISISTARKLCYTRTISNVKFNKSLLIPVTEIDRLIEENLTPALSPKQ